MRREATARTSSYIAVFQSEGDSSSPVSIQVRNCALSRSSSDLVGVLRFDGGSGTRAFGRDTGAGLAVAGLSGLHMSPTDWCPEGADVSSGIDWGAAAGTSAASPPDRKSVGKGKSGADAVDPGGRG